MPFVVFFMSLPSLTARDVFYRSIFVSNSGKHMGSYQMPPRRNALIPFSILSFFMSAPRFNTRVFSLPAALRRVNGEAHRVGPVLPVGLHVSGFLFHRHISLSMFWTLGSSVRLPGIQEGVFPDPLDSLTQHVDPGVGVNPAAFYSLGLDHHGLCSLSVTSIYTFFAFRKSAAV
jgi:hypothetical protein